MSQIKVFQLTGAKAGWLAPVAIGLASLVGVLVAMLVALIGAGLLLAKSVLQLFSFSFGEAPSPRGKVGSGRGSAALAWKLGRLLFSRRSAATPRAPFQKQQAEGEEQEHTFTSSRPAAPQTIALERDDKGVWRK